MNAHYVLDARTATPHFPGIGRYVTNLARAFVPLLAPDERLTVLHDPAYPIGLPPSDAVRTIPLAVSPFSLRQQWIIPRLLRSFHDPSEQAVQLPASSFQIVQSLPQPLHRDALPAGRPRHCSPSTT